MRIWVNTIVNNEENFIWFAVMSVIDFVDKILIYDTGSNDNTVEIINKIKKIKENKIIFKEVGSVNKDNFTKLRQKMLDVSDCDWILILDGDEIWWDDSIKSLSRVIKQKRERIEGIVVPVVVPVGDIYHRQEEEAGKYEILGRKGHYNLRAMNKKIPGLHVDWPYGRESYFDENNLPIQERKDIIFLNAPYLHVTHLRRSSKKRKFGKFKFELGNKTREDFKFPEVLFRPYPKVVSSPWRKISGKDLILSKFLTPLRKIKRRII